MESKFTSNAMFSVFQQYILNEWYTTNKALKTILDNPKNKLEMK